MCVVMVCYLFCVYFVFRFNLCDQLCGCGNETACWLLLTCQGCFILLPETTNHPLFHFIQSKPYQTPLPAPHYPVPPPDLPHHTTPHHTTEQNSTVQHRTAQHSRRQNMTQHKNTLQLTRFKKTSSSTNIEISGTTVITQTSNTVHAVTLTKDHVQ